MTAALAREVFSTSRLAEFCSRQQLVTATGCSVESWPLYVAKELIDNALDDCEEHGIAPAIEIEIATDRITVADNGSGLPTEVLDRILDYESRTSSREAYVSPTRGAQGNALQTILAMPFALDGMVGRITVEARELAHDIEFRIDEIHQTPVPKRSTRPSFVKNGTRITVRWPDSARSYLIDAKPYFLQIADAYTALNPHLNLSLSVDGKQEHYTDMGDPRWSKWRPSDPTSPHWCDTARLKRLIAAYIANGRGSRPVREFLAEFAGLSGSAKQKSVLDATGMARASLDSLVPFDDKIINGLLQAMVAVSKPIKPEVLGIIGQDHWWLTAFCRDGNADSFVYRKRTGCSDGIPWVVEAAFCALSDTERRLIVRGVNFTPSLRDPFQQLVGTKHFYSTSLDSILAARRAGPTEPIAIFVHVTCPRINFTDRGKAGAVLPRNVSQAIIDTVEAVTAKWEKQRRAEDRHASARLRRLAALASHREVHMTIKEAARQVMPEAHDLVSGGGTLPANARQMMYKARPKILELTGKESFTDRYFTQMLLPNYVDDNPEETANWDIVFNARGHFVEPHTELSVPLGTIEVRKYLKERSWHTGLHISSSAYYSTVGPENRYENILFIEKEGFDSLLKAARISKRFDIATTSTKGMSVTAQWELLDALAERGVKNVFVMHDFDVFGIGILATLGTNSRRYKFKNRVNIIDIGLRLTDVKDLTSEPYKVSGDWDKRTQTLRRHGATTDEIEFLRERRVELNAMSSPQFVEFIETKLTEHGVTKLIPDSKILEDHWRRLRAEHNARKEFDEIRERCEAEAKAATPPPDLAQRVAEALQRHPELPWDLALPIEEREP